MRLHASRWAVVQLAGLLFVAGSGAISGVDASLPTWLRVTHGALGLAAAVVAVRVAWMGAARASSRMDVHDE